MPTISLDYSEHIPIDRSRVEIRRKGIESVNEDEFYSGVYSEVQAKGIIGWYVRKSHKALERGFTTVPGPNILEVGANLGEHLTFVDSKFKRYVLSDYRDTGYISKDPKVMFTSADVHKLPFEDAEFDRVIATCLLHHLDKPIDALFEIEALNRPLNDDIYIIIDPAGMFF